MIRRHWIYDTKVSRPNNANVDKILLNESNRKKLRLNLFGLVFNLCLTMKWLFLVNHFILRFKFGITNSKQKCDIIFSFFNAILALYHFLYCVIPSFGVGEHGFWKAIIPIIAVYGQIFLIFYFNLLRDLHYGNYIWSSAIIMGSVSIGILTTNESHGKDSLLLYFKPYSIDSGDEETSPIPSSNEENVQIYREETETANKFIWCP